LNLKYEASGFLLTFMPSGQINKPTVGSLRNLAPEVEYSRRNLNTLPIISLFIIFVKSYHGDLQQAIWTY